MTIDLADIVWLVIVVGVIIAFLAPGQNDLCPQHDIGDETRDGVPSAEERKVAEKWLVEHFHYDCPLLAVSRLSYTFDRHNGIGVGVTARCSCGAYQDVTDYSTW